MESGFLHHYSEDPGIRRFMPRPLSADLGSPTMVWAIDERHAVNYWFPRECPRVIYRTCSDVSGDDGNRLPSLSSADTVITVESDWLERIRTASLYEYIFESAGFEVKDETAGYYSGMHRRVQEAEGGNGSLEIFAVIFGLIWILLFMAVIRYAIDSSKTSKKLDYLLDEIRALRREVRNRSHHIDKKV